VNPGAVASHPLVYEVNTRCWLHELKEAQGSPVTLANVPQDEIARWAGLGFSHIWLMGVWSGGPRSRDVFVQHPNTPSEIGEILPDWKEADIAGSPYAISGYRVPEGLGGDGGLAVFRDQLHAAGLRLMLDFIPNHLGLDHPWLVQHPEYFVHSPTRKPGFFLQDTAHGPRWMAHGKDPYFPAWSDTAQLDIRRADTRAALIQELRSVASRCDAVRCDMSMLLINDVFARNWQGFPTSAPALTTEFWAEAIPAARRPGFLYVAEAYWDLEPELQSMGFDYTYDKRVLDFLIERGAGALQRHLLDHSQEFTRRSAHFLENHDEPRIASRLGLAEHQAAAWLTLALPGLRLLHEGQLTGERVRVPVQLSRRPLFSADPDIAGLYERLFGALQASAVGKGDGRVLRPGPAGDSTHENIIVVQWTGTGSGMPGVEWAVVNLAAQDSRCRVEIAAPGLEARFWKVVELLAPDRAGVAIHGGSLLLELEPHAVRLFRLVGQ